MSAPRPVILCSPYAGDIERNVRYARAAMLDSLQRGEAPFASHLLYPQVLDDANSAERTLGLACEEAWLQAIAHLSLAVGPAISRIVFYLDLGMSPGMSRILNTNLAGGLFWEERYLGHFGWEKP